MKRTVHTGGDHVSITSQKIHIRWLIRRDLHRVLEIERASFDDPWSPSDFFAVLKCRTTIGIVAESGDAVVGYAIYDLLPTRIELINMGIVRELRRTGIGRKILWRLTDRLHGRRSLIRARVSEFNLGAQLFFRQCGFHAVSIERRPYGVPDHDAYVFELRIAELNELEEE